MLLGQSLSDGFSLILASYLCVGIACSDEEKPPQLKPNAGSPANQVIVKPAEPATLAKLNGGTAISNPADAKTGSREPDSLRPSLGATKGYPDAPKAPYNPSEKVIEIALKGKRPAGLARSMIRGRFHKAIAWTDKAGTQALVISTKETQHDSGLSSRLVADFMARESEGWTSKRQFKAFLDKCEFDTTLRAQLGDWSLTDLDKNGLAELSFAWSIGCRSDPSPVIHKVLLVAANSDAGVQKYVLRGTTAVDLGEGLEGGSYEADDAFDQVPASYLEHAKKVWKKTVRHRF